MIKNRGFIVEQGVALTKTVIEMLSIKAFAEEGEPEGGEPANTPNVTINYEDLIAKARREEKEKQYKTIDKLKVQIDTLTTQHNNDLLVIADLQKKLDEAVSKLSTAGKNDTEEVKTLKAEIESLTKLKGELENKVKDFEKIPVVDREEVEAEVRASLEEEYKVKTYKAEKLAELKDEILVPELVCGNTVEEIDASIQSALDRSNEIRKSLGGSPSNKRTPKKVSNPDVSGVQNTAVNLDRLASMDVRSPEYAELRKQLGLR